MSMSTFKNATEKTIEFEIGTRPGSPPEKIKVEPGETYEGPTAYAKAYARQGLVLVEAAAKEVPAKPEPKAELPKPAEGAPKKKAKVLKKGE